MPSCFCGDSRSGSIVWNGSGAARAVTGFSMSLSGIRVLTVVAGLGWCQTRGRSPSGCLWGCRGGFYGVGLRCSHLRRRLGAGLSIRRAVRRSSVFCSAASRSRRSASRLVVVPAGAVYICGWVAGVSVSWLVSGVRFLVAVVPGCLVLAGVHQWRPWWAEGCEMISRHLHLDAEEPLQPRLTPSRASRCKCLVLLHLAGQSPHNSTT